jgi:RNA polymerase sigma-B factor
MKGGARQEAQLFVRVREHADAAATEHLTMRYMALARSIARHYRHTNEPMEDLVQIACVGLVKAIQGFEADRGFAFSSYAVPKIDGEIRRHLRDRSWALHVPRSAQDRALAVSRETKRMETELGRRPTRSELAERLRWELNDVREGERALEAYDTASLDERVPTPDGKLSRLAEVVGDDDAAYEVAEARATIRPALRRVGPTNCRLLGLRFANDLTQREIGERLGYSQAHASRLLRRALDQLAIAVGA